MSKPPPYDIKYSLMKLYFNLVGADVPDGPYTWGKIELHRNGRGNPSPTKLIIFTKHVGADSISACDERWVPD